MNQRTRLLVVALVSVVYFVGIHLAHEPQQPAVVRGDAQVYLAAYDAPRAFVEAPFSYRVLTPVIASLVPTGPSGGFLATTLLGLVGTTVLVFALVSDLVDARRATLAAALFAVSPLATLTLKNHYLVDPLAVALIAAAVLAAHRGRWVWVGMVLALGVLDRENASSSWWGSSRRCSSRGGGVRRRRQHFRASPPT